MVTLHHSSPGDRNATATGPRVAFYLTSAVDGQEAALRAYLKRHPAWRLVTIYRDSGPTTPPVHRRPELCQALRAAASREFDILLTPAMDRVFRRVEHLGGLVDELEAASVTLCSADGRFDSGTSAGRLMAKMFTVFAEYEREAEQRHQAWEREHAAGLHELGTGTKHRRSSVQRRRVHRRRSRRGKQ